ncbi:unnamed protein product [Discosporangium mesarthrocarpum]
MHFIAPDCDSVDQETPWVPPPGFFAWIRETGYAPSCKTDDDVYQLALSDPWQRKSFPWHRASGAMLEDSEDTEEALRLDLEALPWISRKGIGSSGFGGPGRTGVVAGETKKRLRPNSRSRSSSPSRMQQEGEQFSNSSLSLQPLQSLEADYTLTSREGGNVYGTCGGGASLCGLKGQAPVRTINYKGKQVTHTNTNVSGARHTGPRVGLGHRGGTKSPTAAQSQSQPHPAPGAIAPGAMAGAPAKKRQRDMKTDLKMAGSERQIEYMRALTKDHPPLTVPKNKTRKTKEDYRMKPRAVIKRPLLSSVPWSRENFTGYCHLFDLDYSIGASMKALQTRLHLWSQDITTYMEQGGQLEHATQEIPTNVHLVQETPGPIEWVAWAGEFLNWKGLKDMPSDMESGWSDHSDNDDDQPQKVIGVSEVTNGKDGKDGKDVIRVKEGQELGSSSGHGSAESCNGQVVGGDGDSGSSGGHERDGGSDEGGRVRVRVNTRNTRRATSRGYSTTSSLSHFADRDEASGAIGRASRMALSTSATSEATLEGREWIRITHTGNLPIGWEMKDLCMDNTAVNRLPSWCFVSPLLGRRFGNLLAVQKYINSPLGRLERSAYEANGIVECDTGQDQDQETGSGGRDSGHTTRVKALRNLSDAWSIVPQEGEDQGIKYMFHCRQPPRTFATFQEVENFLNAPHLSKEQVYKACPCCVCGKRICTIVLLRLRLETGLGLWLFLCVKVNIDTWI